jgi:hypothetical protein
VLPFGHRTNASGLSGFASCVITSTLISDDLTIMQPGVIPPKGAAVPQTSVIVLRQGDLTSPGLARGKNEEDKPVNAVWEDRPRNSFEGTITAAPIGEGTSMTWVPVIVGGTDAGAVPEGVMNWDFFQGALLAVVVKRPGSQHDVIEGTAVIIAPGLALTATHVFDYLASDLAAGQASLICLGPNTDSLDIWAVRTLSYTTDDDLAYLSLEPLSAIPDGWRISCLPLTTRAPAPGEELTIFGFRLDEVREQGDSSIVAEGDMYVAKGEVTAVYHPMRDSLRMPFPAIEIACDSLGGMSGGAVLDRDGFLVGIISSAYPASEGQTGTTYAAWVIGALNREVRIPWLPAIYSNPIHVLAIPEAQLHIRGRDALTVIDNETLEYRIWFQDGTND